MLRVIPRLVLVEQRDDLADHVAGRIVAALLGHRFQPHPGLLQPPDVVFGQEGIPEEAAEAVDEHQIDRPAAAGRSIMAWNTGRFSSVPEAPGSVNSRTMVQPRCAQ
ncbi:MAG TPA: hypothetical protein VEB64_01345 [Azospirillaceae bacterium]|nr:hypothetical protein [Azospirillaceae bacterium]